MMLQNNDSDDFVTAFEPSHAPSDGHDSGNFECVTRVPPTPYALISPQLHSAACPDASTPMQPVKIAGQYHDEMAHHVRAHYDDITVVKFKNKIIATSASMALP